MVKHPKKAPKTPEFVDTDLGDSNNEQEPTTEQPQKASKVSEFVDTVSCTEDEKEPAIKQPQKASKISGGSDDESPQETSPRPAHKEPTKKLRATSRTPSTSCTHILTSGIRKGKQCRFKASDKTGKFCYHHKQT